jgi:DNA-binding transcriptional ArsR family regulator
VARPARKLSDDPTPAPAPRREPVQTDFPDLDRVIHEKTRLAIVSALAVNSSLPFHEVKAIVKTTDGNVSVHARKLEEAGYLSTKKSFEGRIPKTEYSLTAAGKRAFEKYLAHMEALIKAVGGK